jgi:hypothetical protein
MLKRAEAKRFIIYKRGNPKAVLMSIVDLISTIAPESKALRVSALMLSAKATDKLSMHQGDGEIAAYRAAPQTR